MEIDLKYKCTTDLAELSPLLEFAMTELKKDFMKEGRLESVFSFECDQEDSILELVPSSSHFLQSPELKGMLGTLLRGFAQELSDTDKEPMVVFSACEAWVSAPIDKDDKEEEKRIREEGVGAQDNKKEALIFNFESKTQHRMITYEIIRSDVDDSFVVSPTPTMDEIADKEGGKLTTKFQVWVDGKIWRNEK
jgi:hypothetical protein